MLGLLALEGFLWLSERYRWFPFNEHKGWTVLICLATVGTAFAADVPLVLRPLSSSAGGSSSAFSRC